MVRVRIRGRSNVRVRACDGDSTGSTAVYQVVGADEGHRDGVRGACEGTRGLIRLGLGLGLELGLGLRLDTWLGIQG